MTMDKLELQKLRELPVEGVAERLGLQVTRHKCLCPFHDDHHASLSFSVRRNTFRCFVCGASGGTIDLVMQVLHLSFKEACRWLNIECRMMNAECGMAQSGEKTQSVSGLRPNSEFNPSRYARFFERPQLSEAARRFLFEERKLDERVVRWCRLSSWRDRQGVEWLQIPYYDREGRLTGFQNRNLTPKDLTPKLSTINSKLSTDSKLSTLNTKLSNAPRFRFPQGSDCGIYNLPVLNRLRPDEALFITEGCSDCWAMLSAGHKAVAIPSATLLKPRDMELLSSLHDQLSTEFHMFPDRDVPGERLFLQLKEVLPNLIHHQLPLGCKDYSEYYIKSGRETRDCETRDCETRDCELVTCPEVSCHVSHSTHHHHGN